MIVISASIIIAVLSMCLSLYLLYKCKKKNFNILQLTELKDWEVQKAHVDAKIKANERFDQWVAGVRTKMETENTNMLAQALLKKSLSEVSVSIATNANKHYKKMTQEFMGVLSDETSDIQTNYWGEVAEKIWASFQNYKESMKESMMIFPEGVKIAFTKGNMTVLLIEQKPQTRTICLKPELIKGGIGKHASSTSRDTYRYTIALPYVFFLQSFVGGVFKGQEIYFRNKPLTSSREHLKPACFPNTHKNSSVCMGSNYDLNRSTIAQMSEEAIADFWQSAFNKDLGQINLGSIDAKIKNFAVWQENTKKDPLFILNVEWKKGNSCSTLIERAFSTRSPKNAMDRAMTEMRTTLTNGAEALDAKMKEAVRKGIITKTEIFDPNSTAIVEDLLLNHTRKVFEQCVKIS